MTLDISPEMETLLRLAAAKNGQTVTDYLLSLVQSSLNVDLSEYAGLEDYAASVAGIQAGIEDMEAGRTFSSEEAFAQLEDRKAAWRREKDAQKEKDAQSRRKPQPAAATR